MLVVTSFAAIVYTISTLAAYKLILMLDNIPHKKPNPYSDAYILLELTRDIDNEVYGYYRRLPGG